jgi:DNA-binding LacI/PurR family transcriptional regulator/signal transduction histidine kinase
MRQKPDYIQNKHRRLTIGFLDEDTNNENHNIMVNAIRRTAWKNDVNVIRFGHMRMDLRPNTEYNSTLLEYIKHFRLDGLIFVGWTQKADDRDIALLADNMPIICLGEKRENIHSVFFAGEKYMKELITHLVNVHGLRNIAFVEPIKSDYRSDLYIKLMKKYGIYDPELFISACDLKHLSINQRGKRVVQILLDERRTNVDAIISSYNDETFDIITELKARNISVPYDIAVTSYEDSETIRNTLPSCTTIYFPWDELGTCACKLMCKLLESRNAPMYVTVKGKVIYRQSCGCTLTAVNDPDGVPNAGPYEKSFEELDDSELSEIAHEISKRTTVSRRSIDLLLKRFRLDFYNKSFNCISEIIEGRLLNDLCKNSDGYRFVFVLRSCLMPYFIQYREKDMSRILWAEDAFYYMNTILQNNMVSIWFKDEENNRKIHYMLKEIGQMLITNFSLINLLDSIELNLPRLKIMSCAIYMPDDVKNGETAGGLNKVFEYTKGKRNALTDKRCDKEDLNDTLFSDDMPCFITSQLLYMGHKIMGIVLFEPTIMDVRLYSTLADHISSAINGTMLFDELELGYRRLMDQARKKGMADISTGVLHNIGNVLNSINVTIHTIKEWMTSSPVNDLLTANEMLKRHMDDLDGFMKNDPKGELLMQFYAALGDYFKSYYDKLRANITKLNEKIYIISDIIFAQQKYTVIKPGLEPLDLSAVVGDVLKLYSANIEKYNIRVERNYGAKTKAMAYGTRLFDVIANLVKNAIESMETVSGDTRVLKITIENCDDNVLLSISDTGMGIEQSILESIFNYGYTTKEKGHGFGLHSCANYMSEMNGKIWAESSGVGMGATFILQLRAGD